jgi:hypothetical protein
VVLTRTHVDEDDDLMLGLLVGATVADCPCGNRPAQVAREGGHLARPYATRSILQKQKYCQQEAQHRRTRFYGSAVTGVWQAGLLSRCLKHYTAEKKTHMKSKTKKDLFYHTVQVSSLLAQLACNYIASAAKSPQHKNCQKTHMCTHGRTSTVKATEHLRCHMPNNLTVATLSAGQQLHMPMHLNANIC